jgi:hypothetical protein
MKKASEYRKHADECRALAKRMEQGEHRDQCFELALTWERLAEQRDITSRPGLGTTAEQSPNTTRKSNADQE